LLPPAKLSGDNSRVYQPKMGLLPISYGEFLDGLGKYYDNEYKPSVRKAENHP
jgi:hypothetical protein